MKMQWFLDSSKRQVLKVKTARYTLAGRGGAGRGGALSPAVIQGEQGVSAVHGLALQQSICYTLTMIAAKFDC